MEGGLYSVYNDIQGLKSNRYNAFCKIQILKQLSSLRSDRLHIKNTIQYRGKEISRTDNIEQPIHNEDAFAKFSFSDTDNGLKVVTETVTMGMKQCKYYLNLLNRYSSFATNDGFPDDNGFEPLPASYKMHAADINFSSDNYRRRRLVKKIKREIE